MHGRQVQGRRARLPSARRSDRIGCAGSRASGAGLAQGVSAVLFYHSSQIARRHSFWLIIARCLFSIDTSVSICPLRTQPLLFDGMTFVFHDDFDFQGRTRNGIELLLNWGGGRVLSALPDAGREARERRRSGESSNTFLITRGTVRRTAFSLFAKFSAELIIVMSCVCISTRYPVSLILFFFHAGVQAIPRRTLTRRRELAAPRAAFRSFTLVASLIASVATKSTNCTRSRWQWPVSE
jgi:hypothetical protein